jgi:methyltransferase-like protein
MTEVRKRLSPNVKVESVWSKELEKNYKLKLKNSLANLEANATLATWRKYHNPIETVVTKGRPFTVESFQQMFRDDIES